MTCPVWGCSVTASNPRKEPPLSDDDRAALLAAVNSRFNRSRPTPPRTAEDAAWDANIDAAYAIRDEIRELAAPALARKFDETELHGLPDPVNHPSHYVSHPSGIECIEVTEHMGFCLGNAVKYIWRADLKGNAVEDLRKARFYIDREIAKREGSA